jgi:hypothetical protein
MSNVQYWTYIPETYLRGGVQPVHRGGVGQCMGKTQEYRKKAAHVRRLARGLTDAIAREQLELAAKDYDEIANQLSAEGGTAQVKS